MSNLAETCDLGFMNNGKLGVSTLVKILVIDINGSIAHACRRKPALKRSIY